MNDRPAGAVGGRLFTALFLTTCAAVVTLNRLVDPDLFWHMRGGKDILRAGKAVLPDTWNYLFQGGIWINQQWVTEVLFFKCYDLAGFWGLMAIKGIVVTSVAMLILLMLKDSHPIVRFSSASIFIGCDWAYFLYRTHLFSFLCMAILLYLLERVPSKKRLPWIAVLFAAWANLHTVFGLGLMVLGCHAGVRWLEGIVSGPPSDGVPPRLAERWRIDLWEWLSIPLACCATLLNPFGTGVWKAVFSTFGNTESFLVSEWWPIWRHSQGQLLGFYAFILALAVLICLFPRHIHWPSLVSSTLILIMAVKHARFTSDMILPAIPLFAKLAGAALDKAGERWDLKRLDAALPTVAAALFSLSVLAFSYTAAHPLTVPSKAMRYDYPVKAARWLQSRGMSGKIFSEYGWGGYLAWALPESRTCIDGRTSVMLFPEGHTRGWKDAIDLRPGWRDFLEQGRPDFILLSRDDVLASRLPAEPGWQLVYQDEMTDLYTRRNPAGGTPQPKGQVKDAGL